MFFSLLQKILKIHARKPLNVAKLKRTVSRFPVQLRLCNLRFQSLYHTITSLTHCRQLPLPVKLDLRLIPFPTVQSSWRTVATFKMLQEQREEAAFDLVVEAQGSSTTFLPPPGWQSTQHKVREVIVDVHSRMSSDSSRAISAPVLTLHDVGMDSATCFSSFFSFCHTAPAKCPQLASSLAHYHLTAPGHQPDAPTLAQSEPIDTDELARAVEEVIERFELPRIIAFGVGLGATVLLQVAAKRPKDFLGLVLVSPLIVSSGASERVLVGADGLFTRQLGFGLSRRAKDRFLYRWLSDESRESNFSLVQSLEDGLDRLNASNLLRLLTADTWREDLTQKLASVKARTLLITGKESSLRYHTSDHFASFNPTRTSWLDVPDVGSLVHEEVPERVAESLALYLDGLPSTN